MKSFPTFVLFAVVGALLCATSFAAGPAVRIDPGPLIAFFDQTARALAEPLVWTLAALVVLAASAVAIRTLRSLFPAPQTGAPHQTAFA